MCREKNIIKPKDIDNAVIYDSYWFPDKTICKRIFLKVRYEKVKTMYMKY